MLIYDKDGKVVGMGYVERLPTKHDLVLLARASAVNDVVVIDHDRSRDERIAAIRAEFGDVPDESPVVEQSRVHKGPSVTWGEWITLAACVLLVVNMVLILLLGA